MIYGEAKNVTLSAEELKKLVNRFGVEGAGSWIDRLSLWKASKKGTRVKSDYYTILNWARKDATLEIAAKPKMLMELGENHIHECEVCAKPHKWECGGLDHDQFPCGLNGRAPCREYFRKLDEKKRQKGLFG